jgi:gliding motility-associated-like protein
MSTTMTKHTFINILLSIILFGVGTTLEAQTFLNASINTPANAGVLSESCGGPYELVILRGEDNQDTTLIFISNFGTALIGTDYNFPAGTFPLEMLPEDSVVIIPINVTDDGLPEGLESLGLEIAFLAGTESGAVMVESGIVDDYEVEILSPSDTIQWCRFAPLTLSASSTAEIHWSPAPAFEDPTGGEVSVSPFASGWYFASVGSDTCGAKDSVYLDLAIADIAGPDTVYICLDGDGTTLQGRLEGLATTFVWIPSDTTLSNPNILTPIANPEITTTYILQSDFGICITADTIVVRVDSLPEDQHIDIAPFKPYYCAGEIVALFSPAYDSLDFPDIQFSWIPNNATFKSPPTILNAALELQDTTLYIRENINNACITRDSILINVVPPSVPLSVTDTVLCPGQSFKVKVLSNQVTEPEWTPSDGLSCTQCLEPTVTVIGFPGSQVTYQFSGMILECPVGASLLITIPPVQQIIINGDNVVCEGDMIPLTIDNPEGLSDFSWSVQHGNASLSCSSCPDPTVTINASETINILLNANSSNPNFCGAQGFFQFVAGTEPQVQGPPIVACLGGMEIATTGNPAYTNVQWSVISGNLSLTGGENPTVTVNSAGLLRFFAEVDDPDICRVSGSVAVSIYGGDVSNLVIMPDPSQTEIGQGTEVSVILGVTPPPATVTWTINGVEIPATGTTIEFNADEELNFVEATFINSQGCEQTDTISFPTVPPFYQIPNAFTPDNGDEFNDNFRIIVNGNIVIEKFLIFNRWGQKVYEADDDPLEGWDGRFKDEPAPSDTYVYTANLKFPDGRVEVAKGDVILIR